MHGDTTDKETIGVMLLNLGGPDSIQAVRLFLYNLFSDRQIIQLGPSFMQKPLAWLIAKFRSKKTEKFYSLIGGKSPILDITSAQAKALEEALNQKAEGRKQKPPPLFPPLAKGGIRGGKNSEFQTPNSKLFFKVYIGMRYWHPLIDDVIPVIFKDGIRKLIALSLYPQYSIATTGSSLAQFKEAMIRIYQPDRNEISKINSSFDPREARDKSSFTVHCSLFTVHCVTSWFKHPLYIDALVDVIKKGLESFNPPLPPFTKGGRGGITHSALRTPNSELNVHVLFSAHSLPQSFIDEGDPYVHQTMETIKEINKRIPMKWHLSYQSKSGPVKWLEPSTDEKLKELARGGVTNILVVPISFVSDHIETLYEIDILYKDMAEKLGMNLKRTESLNTHPTFIRALENIVMKNIKEIGWA
ncbi:MAG: ferrochelatase [Nitrospira sp.]|nr:ferrochelatase [Nitrospira sp.]